MFLAFDPPHRGQPFAAFSAGPSMVPARPGPRRVEVGELIALPILAAPGGEPLDLEVVVAGRPAVLLFLPDAAAHRNGAATNRLTSARALTAACSAVLIVVVPNQVAAAAAPSGAVVAVDAGLRFTQMLGLGERSPDGRAAACAALLAVNEVGCVTRVELNRTAR